MKGLSKTDDQISTLSNLGFNNIRDLQALQKLAGSSGIDLLADALEHSNTAWAEGTALQKEFNAKAETTASQVQITKNNLVEAARGIGETFLPTIKNVSGGIKDFAQNIANMSDDSKQRLINIGTGLIGMGAGAKVIAGTTKGIGNFVESLGKLGTVAPTVACSGGWYYRGYRCRCFRNCRISRVSKCSDRCSKSYWKTSSSYKRQSKRIQ